MDVYLAREWLDAYDAAEAQAAKKGRGGGVKSPTRRPTRRGRRKGRR